MGRKQIVTYSILANCLIALVSLAITVFTIPNFFQGDFDTSSILISLASLLLMLQSIRIYQNVKKQVFIDEIKGEKSLVGFMLFGPGLFCAYIIIKSLRISVEFTYLLTGAITITLISIVALLIAYRLKMMEGK